MEARNIFLNIYIFLVNIFTVLNTKFYTDRYLCAKFLVVLLVKEWRCWQRESSDFDKTCWNGLQSLTFFYFSSLHLLLSPLQEVSPWRAWSTTWRWGCSSSLPGWGGRATTSTRALWRTLPPLKYPGRRCGSGSDTGWVLITISHYKSTAWQRPSPTFYTSLACFVV